MAGARTRTPTLLGVAILTALLGAQPAWAHGLRVDDDPNRALLQYVWLGFEHLALGWDHLLFIIGAVLLAPTAMAAAKLVSVFVLGHSVTLLVATLAGWQVSPKAVDVIVALSLVYIGVLGVRGGPRDLRLMLAVVFAFGLVHGLGLSTRLQGIALPEDGLVARILLFNVGIELGQLTVLLIAVGFWTLLGDVLARPVVAQRLAFGGLVVVGLVAAAALTFSAEAEADGPAAGAACSEEPARTAGFDGGSHPPKRFYGPGEDAPVGDFNHILLDGYVVVTYDPELPDAEIQALENWVLERDIVVAARPETEQDDPVVATTVRETLACSEVDLEALSAFRDEWLENRPAQG